MHVRVLIIIIIIVRLLQNTCLTQVIYFALFTQPNNFLGAENFEFQITRRLPLNSPVRSICEIEGYIYVLYRSMGESSPIYQYERDDVKNARSIINTQDGRAQSVLACHSLSCLFVLCKHVEGENYLVLKVTQHKEITPLAVSILSQLKLYDACMAVSVNGDLLLLKQFRNNSVIHVYNGDGLWQYKIRLSLDIHKVSEIVVMRSGNILIVSKNSQSDVRLIEIKNTGNYVRESISSLLHPCVVSPGVVSPGVVSKAGDIERFLLCSPDSGLEVFDRELSVLFLHNILEDGPDAIMPYCLNNSEENGQLIGVFYNDKEDCDYLITLRLV